MFETYIPAHSGDLQKMNSHLDFNAIFTAKSGSPAYGHFPPSSGLGRDKGPLKGLQNDVRL